MTTLRITYCPELNVYRLWNPRTGAAKPVGNEEIAQLGEGAVQLAKLVKASPGTYTEFEVK
jgi:hypothetical protein